MRKSIVLTAAALFTAASALSPSDAVAKPKVSNVSVTKATDKASPNLFRANTAPRDVATGQASGKRQHTPIR
jgi:type VI protein secretion system component Hcp